MQAQHSPHYVRNFVQAAKIVLKWWQTKPGGQHKSFEEGLQWLSNLNTQVKQPSSLM